ncbi:hypothetical protein [Streptomyces sp. NPDC056387]|uniref:hypothetical protein n=1 Tax=Streptomyces sp. NPDC056387 TaxID=3345803 RepID=UPI0035D80414
MSAADPARLRLLRRLFRDHDGPVTTGMAHRLYQAKGIPCRTTARRDLEELVREGLIHAVGPENDRKYLLTKDGGR